jgi:protoheme IX farnesyltransferase
VTLLQTPIGAVAGAIPILLGAATAEAILAPMSWALFGVLFFWQFPHTMAIGWIYREQYATSAVRVATVVDPSGRLAGRLALLGAACLLPVSLVPSILSLAGLTFGITALLSGMAHLALAARFAWRPNDATARALWRVSLAHLPLLLIVLVVTVRR